MLWLMDNGCKFWIVWDLSIPLCLILVVITIAWPNGKEREGEWDGQQREDADPASAGRTRFYLCFFTLNPGKSKSRGPRGCRLHACTWQHIRLNIRGASSPRTRLQSAGMCTMVRGLFSTLMLLAQNLLTQRLRASATFTFAFPKPITMKASSDLCVPSDRTRLKYRRFQVRTGKTLFTTSLSPWAGCCGTYSLRILCSHNS